MICRVLLVGAGAIGMLHAAKLLRDPQVTLRLAADPARRRRYLENGFFFNGERLDFDFAETSFVPELIVIATKFGQYREALDMIAPFVRERTILLPVLNGISSGAVAQERFPQAIVVHGFFLGHASVRNGTHVVHDGVGATYIGALEKEAPDAVAGIRALFDQAGIPVQVPDDMRAALWKKFILNIGVNQTSAYFRADYGTIQQHPEMLELAENLMMEALQVALCEKVRVTRQAIDDAMRVIVTMPPGGKTSMLQDVEANRSTEIDLFAGELLRRAKKYHLSLPANRKVWDQLGTGGAL